MLPQIKKLFRLRYIASFFFLLVVIFPIKINSQSTLNFISPLSGTYSTTINIDLSGDDTASKVWIWTENIESGTRYDIYGIYNGEGGPFMDKYQWDTKKVPNGPYKLYARAYFCSTTPCLYKYATIVPQISIFNPNPTVNITANSSDGPITIEYNTAATIVWNSTYTENCSVSPTGWWGITNNGISTGNLTSSTIYTIYCSGVHGQANDAVTVNVTQPPASSPPPSSGNGAFSNPTNTNKTSSDNKFDSITPEQTACIKAALGESRYNDLRSGKFQATADEKSKVEACVFSTTATVTAQTLASEDKIVIEIPVTIDSFDPDIFLKGNNIKISNVQNIKDNGKVKLRFQGKTKPNVLVTLYIFSQPVIVTVKSDKNGDWVYDREKSIESGKHSVFATIYDDGVTRRSDIASFYLAKTASGSASLILSNNLFRGFIPYILAISASIVVAIIVLVAYRIFNKSRIAKS